MGNNDIKQIVAKDGFSALVVPNGEMSWDVIPKSKKVVLTENEILVGEARSLDLKKFLEVKQLLLDGKNPSQIKKETGTARTTTLKYKLHYDKETLSMLQKIQ